MFKRIMLVVLAGLVMPLSAHALGEKTSLVLGSGGGSYVMKQLNQEIEAYNAANPGSGYQFPTVKRGASLSGACGYELPSRWSFGIGLDRLYASTKASNSGGAMEYNLTANGIRAFGEYGFQPIGS